MRRILILLLLAGLCDAYSTQLAFYDINTLVLVDNLNVSIYNNSGETLYNQLSIGGYVLLNDPLNYTELNVHTIKAGYNDFYSVVNMSAMSNVYYLYPYATNGEIRVKIRDLTFSNRGACVLYDINHRLSKCYEANDTIIFLTNQNYTIIPDITGKDMLLGSNAQLSYFQLYWPYLIGLAFLLPIAGIIVYVLSYAWRLGRGKK